MFMQQHKIYAGFGDFVFSLSYKLSVFKTTWKCMMLIVNSAINDARVNVTMFYVVVLIILLF